MLGDGIVSYQLSLFDIINERKEFKITKPIRLIELFAGYGSQHFALEYLGANFESWKICEWAVKSIQAYKDAHFPNDNTDYSKDLTREQVEDFLFQKGISANYNEPMSLTQIKRIGEEREREIYNNIMATHNLVSVVNCKAKDLEIVDRDKYTYLLTYSFPCQDLSKAGLGKGMAKGSGTRSGMLWEVERILDECNGNLPQVLLMENVPDVISKKNKEDFSKWYQKLESLGYSNFYELLNAKDYGIPQNRNRCFMVSILDDGYYNFPAKIELKKRLKDFLEPYVDEKYCLSDKMKKYIYSEDDSYKVSLGNLNINRDIACTINTRVGNTRADCSDYICDELPSNFNLVRDGLKIKEATKKGYKEALDGDGIDLAYPDSETRRGKVGNQVSQTLTTSDNLGVVVEDTLFTETQAKMFTEDGNVKRYINSDVVDKFNEGQCADISFPNGYNKGTRVHDECPAINTTTTASSFVVKTQNKRIHKIIEDNDLSDKDPSFLDIYNQKVIPDEVGSLKAGMDHQQGNIIYNQLRIRKLTPKECFRLMGVNDKDFGRIARNQSNSSLYHLAGDSIVVNVLMAIFKQMIKIKEI